MTTSEKQLKLKDSFKGEIYLNGVTGTNLFQIVNSIIGLLEDCFF